MMVKTCADTQTISSFINDLTYSPYLAEEKRIADLPKKIKSPGNDGLTVEFFLAFWSLFRKLVVDSLNYTFEHSKLSNSQKQAVITLIEKKGKDKRLVKNWRPISLVNVDAKLASKTLAKRLEKVLPEVISIKTRLSRGEQFLMPPERSIMRLNMLSTKISLGF